MAVYNNEALGCACDDFRRRRRELVKLSSQSNETDCALLLHSLVMSRRSHIC